MDMTKNNLTLRFVLSLGLLMIGFAAFAGNHGSNGSDAENTEVLIGSYDCGVSYSSSEASAYFNLDGTGSLFRDYLNTYRSYEVDAPTAATCDPLVAASSELLEQAGCTTGPVEIRSDGSGAQQTFRFVCHGKRSTVIAIVAKIAEHHFTLSP